MKSYLDGEWYYSYNSSGDPESNNPTEPDKKGEVQITHTFGHLEFSGESFDPKSDQDTNASSVIWNSSSASMSGKCINLSIQFTSDHGGGYGIGVLNIKSKPNRFLFLPQSPTVIRGRYLFTDDNRMGRVVFRRKQTN